MERRPVMRAGGSPRGQFLLAAYVAVLATILGYRELTRDSKRLQTIANSVFSREPRKSYLEVSAINTGTRPMSIQGIYFESATVGDRVRQPDVSHAVEPKNPVPVTLNEGETLSFRMPVDMLIFFAGFLEQRPDFGSIDHVVLRDGDGEEHSHRIRQHVEDLFANERQVREQKPPDRGRGQP
jgi:hypothetical protein